MYLPRLAGLLVLALGAVAQDIKYIISFGDSLSTNGFFARGLPLPSPRNPIGNPEFPGITTVNGNHYSYLDTLISQYNSTTIYNLNFAFWAARHNFSDQATEFLSAVGNTSTAEGAAWRGNNTLFSVWWGRETVEAVYDIPDWANEMQRIVGVYFDTVEKLYKAGARRFLFLTVPPVERSPVWLGRTQEERDGVRQAIRDINDHVKATTQGYFLGHAGLRVQVVDTDGVWNKVLDEAGEEERSCADSEGVECAWFDEVHPGQKIHDEMAKVIAGNIKF